MGIALLVIVVLVSLALTVRAWKGYETELRKNAGTRISSGSFDPLLFQDSGSAATPDAHPSHHGDFGCVDTHHGGCDIGGHGGFDGGHSGGHH